MNEVITKVFLECARAIDASQLITRVSSTDKEYSFQYWFLDRLKALGLNFDEPSRNAYPDFRLVDYPVGFEIKGLGFPGREANYDCNSQVPSGRHHGREIYYVFGRYPANSADKAYPVYDLDMVSHELKPSLIPNPSSGKKHPFKVFRAASANGPEVTLS